MATINELVWAYQHYKAPNLLISLNNVLKCRQYSKGKMSPRLLENIIIGGHQHRLKHHAKVNYPILKRNIRVALTNPFPILTPSKPYKDFVDLYDELKRRLYPYGKFIKGIGDLTLYDMALRIGYIMLPEPVLPDKKLYLFSGAFDGYCELQRCYSSLGLPSLIPGVYDMTLLSGVFGSLSSMFVEDLLCVYHSDFQNLSRMSLDDLQKKLTFGRNVPQIYKL